MNHQNIFFLLCLSILFVGYQSGVYILAIPALLFAFQIWLSNKKGTAHPLRKRFLYLAILPFSFWWFISPSIEGQISPWLFFIPAWYCLFLALMQWRSIGNGGELVFVRFNVLAAFLFSIRNPDRYAIVLAILFVAFFLWHIRPRLSLLKWIISLYSVFIISFLILFVSTTIKSNRSQGRAEKWSEDFYLSRHMIGFDPVAALGSFGKNYNSKYDDQIVLRLWTSTPPIYFKSITYERYIKGLWKISNNFDVFYPERYDVDYAIFESNLKTEEKVEKVWVQSVLKTFQYLFAPSNAIGVSVKAADSVYYYRGGAWKSPEIERADWYYYFQPAFIDTSLSSSFLNIADRDLELVKNVSFSMGLDTLYSVPEKIARIKKYFLENFGYSLNLPLRKKDNPLEVFWKTREGFCEYFATLTTLVLRYHNIPARYVVGFAFPEFSENEKYAFFRRRNSHAWVEYFDSSWKIIDPTPIIVQRKKVDNFWSQIQEKIKAQSAYLIHKIKEGAWRQKLDVWQIRTEKILTSFEFYLILGAFFIAYFVIKRRKAHLKPNYSDPRELYWRSKLKRALLLLEKMGYHRNAGETIGNFILRINAPTVSAKAKIFEKQIEILKTYQKERWRANSK